MIKIDQIVHNQKNPNASKTNMPINYTNMTGPGMFPGQKPDQQHHVDTAHGIDAKNFLDNGSISTKMNIGEIGTPSVKENIRNEAESPLDAHQHHVLTPMNRRGTDLRLRNQSSKEIQGSKKSIKKPSEKESINGDQKSGEKIILSSGDGVETQA
jgi:hypothetical protein